MKTKTHTNLTTSIIKKCIVLCVFCLTILNTCLIQTFAATTHLTTLLLMPEDSITYTDYDSAYLTIVNKDTGESFHYTLYPYNNFADRIELVEGTYMVVDAGINGKYDTIFEFEAEDVSVTCTTVIKVKLKDSGIMQSTTATTKKTTTTTANSTQNNTTTEQKTLSTLFSSLPATTKTPETNTSDKSTSPATTTITTSSQTQNNNNVLTKTAIPFAIIAFLILIILIVFAIVLARKNKSQ